MNRPIGKQTSGRQAQQKQTSGRGTGRGGRGTGRGGRGTGRGQAQDKHTSRNMKKFTYPIPVRYDAAFRKGDNHKKLLADHPKVKIHVEHRDTKYKSPGGRTDLVNVIIHAPDKASADLCFADGSKTIRELMRTNPAPSKRNNSKRNNSKRRNIRMKKSKTLPKPRSKSKENTRPVLVFEEEFTQGTDWGDYMERFDAYQRANPGFRVV